MPTDPNPEREMRGMIVESKVDASGIRTITLNRPPANAINYEMMHAVRDAFIEADRDWNTKVVVLESSDARFFCAGMDVKQPRPAPETLPEAVPQYGSFVGREVFRVMYECGVPVIAKVRGIAVGAGFLYACLADFCIASETARFGQFEIKVGAVGGAGIVRRMMSEQAMRYLTWTAELAPVSELVALGAGIKVVSDAELDETVLRTASLLASRSAHLTRHTKLSLNRVEHMGGVEAYAFEQMHSEVLHLRNQQ
jgi:enoyl-CoA hydratase/carnithine racemase